MKYFSYLMVITTCVTTLHATSREDHRQRYALLTLEKKPAAHAAELALGLHFGEPRQKISSVAHSDIAAMVASTVKQKHIQKNETQIFYRKQIKKNKLMRKLYKRH